LFRHIGVGIPVYVDPYLPFEGTDPKTGKPQTVDAFTVRYGSTRGLFVSAMVLEELETEESRRRFDRWIERIAKEVSDA
jgi:hypothetical protein